MDHKKGRRHQEQSDRPKTLSSYSAVRVPDFTIHQCAAVGATVDGRVPFDHDQLRFTSVQKGHDDPKDHHHLSGDTMMTEQEDSSNKNDTTRQDTRFRKISRRNLPIESKETTDKLKQSPPERRRRTSLEDKLDRSNSTTKTASTAPFTFSSSSDHHHHRRYDDTSLVSEQTFNPTTAKKKSKRRSFLQKVDSDLQPSLGRVPSASTNSTWRPANDLWGDEDEDDDYDQQADERLKKVDSTRRKKHTEKPTADPVRVSRAEQKTSKQERKKKHRSKSARRRRTMGNDPLPSAEPLSPSITEQQQSHRHVRKTMRRSQSERMVTRASPGSVNSQDLNNMSNRDVFRQFLLDDKKEQKSRRNLAKDKKRKHRKKRSKSTPRPSRQREESTRNDKPQVSPLSDDQSRPSLMQKQMSLSQVIESSRRLSPSLHSVFEWTKSHTSPEDGKPKVGDDDNDEVNVENDPKTPTSRHRAPSSRGKINRRTLHRKTHSSSDIHKYHVTPEWPSQRRNVKLHSLFYDLSMRRTNLGGDGTSRGVPTVSAGQMLDIMEPCSKREVMNAQGKDFEPPLYREDYIFNYGDVMDTISLTSSQSQRAMGLSDSWSTTAL